MAHTTFFSLPIRPGADHFDGQAEAGVAALPGADLNDPSRFLGNAPEDFAFVHRKRDGLFDVDILSGTAGVDGHLDVPVIGGTDGDHVDVLVLEERPIVLVDFRRASESGAGLFAYVTIHIGDGHDIAVVLGLQGDDSSLVSHPNGTDAGAIVLRFRPRLCRGVSWKQVGRNKTGPGKPCRLADEVSTILFHAVCLLPVKLWNYICTSSSERARLIMR